MPRLTQVAAALQRRVAGARVLSRIVRKPAGGVRIVGDLSAVELALVSAVVPPMTSGYALILEELFGGIPENRMAIITPSPLRWGSRPAVQLSSGPGRLFRVGGHDLVEDGAAALESALMAGSVARQMPRLRAVVGLFDRYMVTARRLAKAGSAHLWFYAIDDFTPHGSRWLETERQSALGAATGVAALSPEMGAYLGRYGVNGARVVPPLTAVPAAPCPFVPGEKRRFIFVGNLSDYHRAPMERLAREAATHPNVELLLVTPGVNREFRTWLPPRPWTVIEGGHGDVTSHISQAHVGLILLGPWADPGRGMTVAFPTKLRDYAAVGRPILAFAPEGSCTTRVLGQEGIGRATSTLDALAIALHAYAQEPLDALASAGGRAHAFALRELDARVQAPQFWQALGLPPYARPGSPSP